MARGKFFAWRHRYGKANEHNAWVPRDHWIEEHERQAILDFHERNPLEGYRRLAFMMIDADVVAVSPATVYRVLSKAGRLDRWPKRTTSKGKGFVQPLRPHEHWHVDIAHLNVAGTFYYLCSVLDGASRVILHWEIRESMCEADVECVLQKAHELYPDEKPRVISDNGPQFIAKDFKEFIRLAGLTHVLISPYYPQSNGKIERWHRTMKGDALRPHPPASLSEARTVVGGFVEHYNHVRLHSALGYIAPHDFLDGRAPTIWSARDRKLEAARHQRQLNRQAQRRAA